MVHGGASKVSEREARAACQKSVRLTEWLEISAVRG